VVRTPAMTITVEGVDGHGAPTAITVRFPQPLDAAENRFLVYDAGGLKPIPAPATSVSVPARVVGIP